MRLVVLVLDGTGPYGSPSPLVLEQLHAQSRPPDEIVFVVPPKSRLAAMTTDPRVNPLACARRSTAWGALVQRELHAGRARKAVVMEVRQRDVLAFRPTALERATAQVASSGHPVTSPQGARRPWVAFSPMHLVPAVRNHLDTVPDSARESEADGGERAALRWEEHAAALTGVSGDARFATAPRPLRGETQRAPPSEHGATGDRTGDRARGGVPGDSAFLGTNVENRHAAGRARSVLGWRQNRSSARGEDDHVVSGAEGPRARKKEQDSSGVNVSGVNVSGVNVSGGHVASEDYPALTRTEQRRRVAAFVGVVGIAIAVTCVLSV